MALDVGSHLTLAYDMPIPALAIKGTGGHLKPEDIHWTADNVLHSGDRRGWFLAPLHLLPAWKTTYTGLYARHRLTDFTSSGFGSSWKEVAWNDDADYWLYGKGQLTSFRGLMAGANLKPNPHIHIELWIEGPYNDTDLLFEVQIGPKWKLRLYGSGAGQLIDVVANETRALGTLLRAGRSTHDIISLWIAPLFHRCIYIFSNQGPEFVYEDLSLDPSIDSTATDAVAPLIPAGPLVITANSNMLVQPVEVAFNASGKIATVAGDKLQLPYPPLTLPLLTNQEGDSLAWYDAPAGSSVTVTMADYNGVGFVANGTNDRLPFRVDMAASADRRSTPTFYGCGFRMDPTSAARSATTAAILQNVLPSTTLSVGEEDTHMNLALTGATGQTVGGAPLDWRVKQNRVVTLSATDGPNTWELFRGFTSAPSVDDYNGVDVRGLVAYDVADEWKRLNVLLLPSTNPYDGMKVSEAVRAVMKYCGYTDDDLDIDDTTFRLPVKKVNEGDKKANGKKGTGSNQPLVQPGTGVAAAEFLRYLRDTYTNWWMDFSRVGNVVKFRFKNPRTYSSVPVVTFYRSRNDAVLGGAISAAPGLDMLYRVENLQTRRTEPEATDVLIVGQTVGGEPLYAFFTDADAQNPELPEVDRKANWVGEPRRVILVDPSLATQSMVNRAAKIYGDRLTVCNEEATWTSEFMPQLRRHDTVRIEGAGDFELVSMNLTWEREATVALARRRACEYQASRVVV